MRIFRTLISTATAMAAFVSSAHAVVLYTAPAPTLVQAPGSRRLYCDINNVTAHNVAVDIEVRDALGGVVQLSGETLLGPGMGWAVADFGELGSYCKFIVRGGKATVRALAVYDDGTDYNIIIPAE